MIKSASFAAELAAQIVLAAAIGLFVSIVLAGAALAAARRMNYGDVALGVECALPRRPAGAAAARGACITWLMAALRAGPEEPRRRARRARKGGSGHGTGGARRLRQTADVLEESRCNAALLWKIALIGAGRAAAADPGGDDPRPGGGAQAGARRRGRRHRARLERGAENRRADPLRPLDAPQRPEATTTTDDGGRSRTVQQGEDRARPGRAAAAHADGRGHDRAAGKSTAASTRRTSTR